MASQTLNIPTKIMQETKHFLHCAKQLTLTPSGFLLSKVLAAVEGKTETTFQYEVQESPVPEATQTCSKHINLCLSPNSRCKIQLQDP